MSPRLDLGIAIIMGSYKLLVIGDWREQLEPLLDVAHIGNPLSPYITCTVMPNTALMKEFRQSQKNVRRSQRVPFQTWLKTRYCLSTLAANENPDLAGAHRNGWKQLNAKGKVTEVILRNVDPYFQYVAGDIAHFLLKPGAIGWDVLCFEPNDLIASDSYVSSARLCDIDFATMREPKISWAPTNWDRASLIAAGRTWIPLKEFRKKYQGTDPYPRLPGSDSISEYHRAKQEWQAQPIVQQLLKDAYLARLGSALDALMLPRKDYIQHWELNAPVLECVDVLHQHRFLYFPDESDLLAELDDEMVLTYMIVR